MQGTSITDESCVLRGDKQKGEGTERRLASLAVHAFSHGGRNWITEFESAARYPYLNLLTQVNLQYQ